MENHTNHMMKYEIQLGFHSVGDGTMNTRIQKIVDAVKKMVMTEL